MNSLADSRSALLVLVFLLLVSTGCALERAAEEHLYHEQNDYSHLPDYPGPDSVPRIRSAGTPLTFGATSRIRQPAGHRTDFKKDGYLAGRFHNPESRVLTILFDDVPVTGLTERTYRLETRKSTAGSSWTGAMMGAEMWQNVNLQQQSYRFMGKIETNHLLGYSIRF